MNDRNDHESGGQEDPSKETWAQRNMPLLVIGALLLILVFFIVVSRLSAMER